VVEWEAEGGAQNWYRKGWIIDLRPYLTDERRALTTEEQWKAREFPDDGAIISSATVLWEPLLMVLYNPAHLEAAGIEPATVDDPWSWEEFYENARLLTLDANGKHLGEEGFDPNQVVQWGFLPRLDPEKVWEWGLIFSQQRMGQPVIREEDGKWGWYLDEAGAEVYEKILTPLQEGISPELAIGISGDSLHQAFVDGMASMIIRESFGIPIIHDNFPDFAFAAMPTPTEPGEKVFYKAGGEGMVITQTCEHPEEAAEFVFWAMKPENLATYAYQNGMLPGNYEALEVEPFKSDPAWDIIRDYLARSEVFTTPFNPHLVEFRDTIVAPTLMEVVEGQRTFAEANELLKEQAELVLNQ
jgi:ABC-type glycerol-3-phosphate transport system substrate-binding protein